MHHRNVKWLSHLSQRMRFHLRKRRNSLHSHVTVFDPGLSNRFAKTSIPPLNAR
jgi:hypothetical protein